MTDPTLQLVLAVLVGGLLALLLARTWQELRATRERFAPIIDIEEEHTRLTSERDALSREVDGRRGRWKREVSETVAELEALTLELDGARDAVELQSFGIYEPQFAFDTSEQYKVALADIRSQQKLLVRDGGAAVCNTEWEVSGSRRKGKAMTNRNLKLQLRAFNGECDVAVAKVRYNNVHRMERRIEKSMDALNRLGEPNHCRITESYLLLKLKELHLAFEHEQKKQTEKEEQREIRAQMREDARAEKEIEKARHVAEREEDRYGDALAQARDELRLADERKREALNTKIQELERRLEEAHANKERAISRAQLTKSGHVYVISNVGSFKDRIYKIGMTRRLDPIDRVKELGDASVPFPFDVHAMIYSENAPELENRLHKAFEQQRVNLVNLRREYFDIDLEDIQRVVREYDPEIAFTVPAEAPQFRQSEALRKHRDHVASEEEPHILRRAHQLLEDLQTRSEQADAPG